MKKYVWLFLGLSLIASQGVSHAEDAPAAAQQNAAAPAPAEPAAAPAAEATPVAAAPAAAAQPVGDVSAPVEAPTGIAENLEFVSGEVSATDEAAKKVTVKLYGETENDANDKLLTVSVDDSTDITDGEKDRDLKSLAAGTEVDVEYDPTTSKATYIFVY